MPLTVDQLRARLNAPPPAHRAFSGPAPEVGVFTAHELGNLWPDILRARGDYSNEPARMLAEAVIACAAERAIEPALDVDACMRIFNAMTVGDLQGAVNALAYVACAIPVGLGVQLRRILGALEDWSSKPYEVYALARFTDRATQDAVGIALRQRFATAPFRLEEIALLDTLGNNAILALAGCRYYLPTGADLQGDDAAMALSQEAPYLAFAESALARASAHVQAIASGTVPYKADAAFALDDTPVLGCAYRVAALRDEPWLRTLIGPLLAGVCVAPTAAKTCPSQSLAIALGHSIQGVPTPESLQALRTALSLVRHAGVEKKLARNLKPAERALAERPQLAPRLLTLGLAVKQQRSMLANCLEAGWYADFALTWAQWKTAFASDRTTAAFTRDLIWQSGARSFMLDADFQPHGTDGQAIALADTDPVILWHPATSNEAEIAAWQMQLSARQLRQPLRQAWREWYCPQPAGPTGATSAFSGHVLGIRTLIGLARREGWHIDDGTLVRQFGLARVAFDVDVKLYPGAIGWTVSGAMRFAVRHGSRWMPAALDSIAPVTASEACRAVDLLASAAAFAIAAPEDAARDDAAQFRRLGHISETPPSAMLRMRRAMLARAFAGAVERGEMQVEARHVVIGECKVHLATARVTQAGMERVLALPDVPSNLRALPWLPYDEKLLEQIVRKVAALLGQSHVAGHDPAP